MEERLIPDISFPPYSYVPGKTTRPVAEHLPDFSVQIKLLTTVDFSLSRPYLYSLDLFNHGYYWEAHEIWETFWNHFGRTGQEALFFKALIKLAAAGVKKKAGNSRGYETHLKNAAELFKELKCERFGGLVLTKLINSV